MRSRRLHAACGAVALGFILIGCSGGSSAGAPSHLGGLDLGTQLRLADCTDWEAGTAGERLGTVAEIARFAGGPVGNDGGHGATLDPNDAYDVMEEYCSHDFARGFKLYKLYTRAAALRPPG